MLNLLPVSLSDRKWHFSPFVVCIFLYKIIVPLLKFAVQFSKGGLLFHCNFQKGAFIGEIILIDKLMVGGNVFMKSYARA